MPRKPKAPKSYFPFWGGKMEAPEGVTLPTSKEPMTPETWATHLKIIKEMYAEPRMEACQREFEESGNPLFAWCAFEIWLAWGHHCKIDMPVWLRNHFWKTSASSLAEGVIQEDVPEILGFVKKQKLFDRYRLFMRDIKLALRVAQLHELGETKDLDGGSGAFKIVADESGLKEGVVKEAFYKFNKQKQ